MCRNAHKVVQPYYSMCYFIYSFIYSIHMFSIFLSVCIKPIEDHTKPELAKCPVSV